MQNKILLLFILIKLLFSSIFGWDDVGHKTTAYIAWQLISPQAREEIIRIFLYAPEDSNLGALFASYDARPIEVRKLEFFMLASIWADLVRDPSFILRHQKYHQGSWHYINKFWKQENGQIKLLQKPEGEDAGKALEKLFEFEKILKDKSTSDSEKSIALAWFLHVAGDIHQPLHNSSRITDEEPKGDRGGNFFFLTPRYTPRERQENLHWYWDSIIVRNIERGLSCDLDFIGKLANELMRKYPFEKMKPFLEIGKYDRWHEEGFQIATKEVYPTTLKRFEMPSAEYRKKALEISERQIVLAGYRIGVTLNQIFGK